MRNDYQDSRPVSREDCLDFSFVGALATLQLRECFVDRRQRIGVDNDRIGAKLVKCEQ